MRSMSRRALQAPRPSKLIHALYNLSGTPLHPQTVGRWSEPARVPRARRNGRRSASILSTGEVLISPNLIARWRRSKVSMGSRSGRRGLLIIVILTARTDSVDLDGPISKSVDGLRHALSVGNETRKLTTCTGFRIRAPNSNRTPVGDCWSLIKR